MNLELKDLHELNLKVSLYRIFGLALLTSPSEDKLWEKTVKLLVAQSYLTLCDLMDWSPPSFSVHGILQARILEWVAILFSRGSSQLRDRTWVSSIAGRLLPSEPSGKPTTLARGPFEYTWCYGTLQFWSQLCCFLVAAVSWPQKWNWQYFFIS